MPGKSICSVRFSSVSFKEESSSQNGHHSCRTAAAVCCNGRMLVEVVFVEFPAGVCMPGGTTLRQKNWFQSARNLEGEGKESFPLSVS
jgi:hypothetical protein